MARRGSKCRRLRRTDERKRTRPQRTSPYERDGTKVTEACQTRGCSGQESGVPKGCFPPRNGDCEFTPWSWKQSDTRMELGSSSRRRRAGPSRGRYVQMVTIPARSLTKSRTFNALRRPDGSCDPRSSGRTRAGVPSSKPQGANARGRESEGGATLDRVVLPMLPGAGLHGLLPLNWQRRALPQSVLNIRIASPAQDDGA